MARKKESYVPDPTPDKQLTVSSGWCITSDHHLCKYSFSFGMCGCKCHAKSGRKNNE